MLLQNELDPSTLSSMEKDYNNTNSDCYLPIFSIFKEEGTPCLTKFIIQNQLKGTLWLKIVPRTWFDRFAKVNESFEL